MWISKAGDGLGGRGKKGFLDECCPLLISMGTINILHFQVAKLKSGVVKRLKPSHQLA